MFIKNFSNHLRREFIDTNYKIITSLKDEYIKKEIHERSIFNPKSWFGYTTYETKSIDTEKAKNDVKDFVNKLTKFANDTMKDLEGKTLMVTGHLDSILQDIIISEFKSIEEELKVKINNKEKLDKDIKSLNKLIDLRNNIYTITQ
jgi:hypothetical protein